jgi:DNA-binding Lrp family transcriptional regulator
VALKKYKSHKVVMATKIISYEQAFDDTNNMLGYILTDSDGDIHEASASLFARGEPKDDYFYLVKYDDNYISWSPKKAFEDGYYIYNYDIKGTSKIYNYKRILHIKLKAFYEYNKTFGRRIIKITRLLNKTVKKEYIYNSENIPFHKIYFKNNAIYDNTVIRVETTINALFNNNIFNVVNNYYEDHYSDDSDDSSDMNNPHNTDDDTQREFEELSNHLQSLNLANNNDYEDDEQKDDDSIS